MSLNWSIENIKDFEQLKVFGKSDDTTGEFIPAADGDEWILRTDVECLMWLSITCGYSKITENNLSEVFTRIAMVETICGAYRNELKQQPDLEYEIAELKRISNEKHEAFVAMLDFELKTNFTGVVAPLQYLKAAFKDMEKRYSLDVMQLSREYRAPRYFTLAEVERCIGLSTNATVKTNGQFDKDIAKLLRESVKNTAQFNSASVTEQ